MNWQPIETAPKDGTKILCGRFKEGDEHDGFMAVDRWHSYANDGYQGFGKFNDRFWPPTHWITLPDRPATAQETE